MNQIGVVFGTIRSLFAYLWKQRLWWLMPLIVVLVLLGVVIVLGSSTGLGPLIYTLF